MAEPVFEIFKDKKGRHRFRLKAKNQEIIAASQGYSSKQAVMTGIDSIKENASKADVIEKGEDRIKIWEEGAGKTASTTEPEAAAASTTESGMQTGSTTEEGVVLDSTTIVLSLASFLMIILAVLMLTF